MPDRAETPPPLSRLFSADRAGTPFRWGSTVTAKWPARGRGFGATPPKETFGGGAGAHPPPRRWRLSAIRKIRVRDGAPQELQCEVFSLTLYVLSSLVQLQCEVSSLTLCSWVFSGFRFRYIYPCLHNQPLQVRSYSVKFLLSSESDWDGLLL